MGTWATSPSRRTLAVTTIIVWRAATLDSALPSWLRLMKALKSGQDDEHDAGPELAGQEERDDAGHQQHDLHGVAVLAQEGSPAWLPGGLGEPVGPEGRTTRGDLSRGEAGGRIDLLLGERLFGAQSVPGRAGARAGGC